MTREEAIQMLIRMQEFEAYEPQITADAYDALQMGIEALRNKNDLPISPLLKEPKQPENGSEQFGDAEKLDDMTTDDLISKRDVFEMLKRECSQIVEDFLKDKINSLPSAQPDKRWNRLMMYLADLQLTYSPGWGANGCGDQKLYDFVTELIERLEGWENDE